MAAVAPDGNVSVDIDSDAEADGVALSGAGASAGGGVADEDAVTASEHDALLAEGAAHVAPIMDEDDDDEQLHARPAVHEVRLACAPALWRRITSKPRLASTAVFTFIAFILLIVAYRDRLHPPPDSHTALPLHHDVTSSPYDTRQYAHTTLENGLQVLIVQDETRTTAGAAMNVGVGSMHDAPDFPGLAHAVEHCLFLGTRDYPSDSEHSQFLATHGGSANAYTSLEDTNYFFSVSSDALDEALSRFSGFFKAPLFLESAIVRELAAVESEHSKNLQSDAWRGFQLLKHMANPASRFNSFSTGSLATLNHTGIRAAMMAFTLMHYTAPNMRLTIVAPQPARVVAAMVNAYFATIPTGSPLGDAVALSDKMNASLPTRLETTVAYGQYAGMHERARSLLWERMVDVSNALDQLPRGFDAERMLRSMWRAAVAARVQSSDSIFTQRGVRVDFPTVSNTHEVSLYWPLPGVYNAHTRFVGAADFVAGLLSRESVGSLCHALRTLGLASECSAEAEATTVFSSLSLTLTLHPTLVALLSGATLPAPTAGVDAQQVLRAFLNDYISAFASDAQACAPAPVLLAALNALGVAAHNGEDQAALTNLLVQTVTHAIVSSVNTSVLALRVESCTAAAAAARDGLVVPLPNDPVWAECDALLPPPSTATANDTRARTTRDASVSEAAPSALPSLRALWQEEVSIANASFLFPRHADAADTASQLARRMRILHARDALLPPAKREWDAEDVDRVVSALTVTNALVFVGLQTWPGVSFAHVEPVYATQFNTAPLLLPGVACVNVTSVLQQALHDQAFALSIPPRNAFVPTDFSLVSGQEAAALLTAAGFAAEAGVVATWPAGEPSPVHGGAAAAAVPESVAAAITPVHLPLPARAGAEDAPRVPTRVWWWPDVRFRQPRAVWTVDVLSVAASRTLDEALLSELHCAVLTDALRPMLDDAARAGAHVSISSLSGARGLSLRIDSFADALPALVRALAPRLLQVATSTSAYSTQALRLLEKLEASRYAAPYALAVSWVGTLVRDVPGRQVAKARRLREMVTTDVMPPTRRALQSISSTGIVQLQAHVARLAANVSAVVVAAHGNLNSSLALDLARIVVDAVEAARTPPPPYNSSGATSVVVNTTADAYFTAGADSLDVLRELPDARTLLQGRVYLAAELNSAVVMTFPLGLVDECATRMLPTPLEAFLTPINATHTVPPEAARSVLTSGAPHAAPPLSATSARALLPSDCMVRSVAAIVLRQLMHDAAFNTLRTQQQLGYIVYASMPAFGGARHPDAPPAYRTMLQASAVTASVRRVQEATEAVEQPPVTLSVSPVQVPVSGDRSRVLQLVVQSSVADPHTLRQRMLAFVQGWRMELAALPDADWQAAVAGVRAQLLEAPGSLEDAFAAGFAPVRSFTYRTSAVQEAVRALDALRLADVVSVWNECVVANPRRLLIEMYGGNRNVSFGADVLTFASAAWNTTALQQVFTLH